MKCSKCGGEIPAESRFCLSCGEIVSESPRQTPAAQPPKKRTALWAGLAGLVLVAVVVVIALGMRGSRVAEVSPVPAPQQAPVVNVPGMPSAPQPSVLDTDVEKPPLDLKKDEKPEPPAEVIAYLEHLKKVEKARQDITAKELNDLVAMAPELIAKAYPLDGNFDESQAPKELSKQVSRYTQEWQQIAQYFVSVRPPDACADLAGKYYDALRDFVGFMGRFQESISKQDLAGLQQMKKDHVSVDQKLSAADNALAQVCNRFGIEKSFRIQSDTGQTPLMGF